MTGTEERLRDALRHAARTVEAPPPFTAPARRRVLTRPLATALAVAAVLGGVVHLVGGRAPTGELLSPPPASQRVSVYLCTRTSSNRACDGEATERQRQAIGEWLRSLPGVRSVSYESKEEAYDRFREVVDDEPGFVAATRPGDVPDSFRVQAEPGSVHAIAAALDGFPGVDQVVAEPPGEP